MASNSSMGPINSRVSPTPGGPAARRRLSHGVAFVAVAAVFICFMAASAAPSPLYVVYQEAWGFSTTTLTFVFAIYVIALLGSLLVLGALSDHIGRRPVLAIAIALESIALILFIVADGVALLVAARVIQGVATGAAMTTLGAALIDLNPPHAPDRAGVVSSSAPVCGIAFGALGCGALVQFAPAPMDLVYAILLGGMAVSAAVAYLLPETSTKRPGGLASLKPRLSIPPRLRRDVYALVPILLASWSLGGLYMSLGPSDAVDIFGLDSHLIGGLVVTLMCGTGGVTAILLRNWEVLRLVRLAGVLLAGGIVLTLIGIETGSAAVAAVGTVCAGVGFGAAGLGAFGTLARIATPDERGELFAVAFVLAYLGFSLPAMLAGFVSTEIGLERTTLFYGIGVILLALAALGAQRMLERRRAPQAGDSSVRLPEGSATTTPSASATTAPAAETVTCARSSSPGSR